jgi:hypothetical protein
MGEIAEMMLDGTLCAGCGEYLGRDLGFPQYCDGCEDPLEPPQPGRKKRRELDGRSALPRFNRYSIPPRPGTIQCKHCPAWVKPNGMHDHMHAKHLDIIKRGSK